MLINSNTTQENISSDLGASAEGAATRQADIACAWAEWINGFACWKSFWTLTVSNEHACSRDTFVKRVRTLVQILNRDLYGNHYIRIVGHSYFSHVLGIEYTKNGVIHGHMLVDKPTNFQLAHSVWEKMSGFVFIKAVYDAEKVSRYISKYVSKGEDLELIYKATSHKSPHEPIPFWYANNL